MAETLIKNFTQISKADTEIAGGKGASLGEMTQAGIPVPGGFVILSNAFDRFLEETDLNIEIDAVLDTVDIKEVHTVENASEKIQAMILSREIPEDIKTEIFKFSKNLDSEFVAVRSSATSEDSASAAWAGQLESYLNTTENTLLENVKKCWASLFTPRAIFYRFEKKLNKDKIAVAVVVQKMVDSEESGIAFSVHPVTQDENQIIIEAGFGLGEAIVSGSITPDSYVIDKQGFSILDINVNEQIKALYKKAKGGNEWKELEEKGKKQVLTEEEIVELSKLIVKIENHYGFPCDIEWAKEKGKFYIVQSRPITTLIKKEEIKEKYYKFGFFVHNFFYTPVTKAARIKYEGNYVIKNWFLKTEFGKSCLIYVPKSTFLETGDKLLKRLMKNEPTFTKDLFKICKQILKLSKFLEQYSYNIFSNKEDVKLEDFYFEYENVFSRAVAFGYALDFALEEYLKENPVDILDSKYISFNKIEELELKQIKNVKELNNHICKYFWMKADYSGGNEPQKDFFINRWKQIKTEEKQNLIENPPITLPTNISDWIELLTYIRDVRKKCNLIANALLDRYLKQRSKKEELSYEKCSMLFLDEFVKYKRKDLTKIVVNNPRFVHIKNKEIAEMSDLEWNLKFSEKSKLNLDKDEIGGIVANKGIVRGNVRMVIEKKDFKEFKEGEILVTHMTRPNFIPLMEVSSGIITDEGGITCHAAIISRELDKPCLIGTQNATEILKNGDLVDLDANQGIVKILKKKK